MITAAGGVPPTPPLWTSVEPCAKVRAMLEPSLKTKIMDAVDRRFDDQTRVLADLVKIPSTRFREAPAQDMMARLFKKDGLGADRWQIKIDALNHLPGYPHHSPHSAIACNVPAPSPPPTPHAPSPS